MKKSLIVTLALVFVLGIAGTALAANPFTDVPANHWAYASISKLAQAGIIEGYGDGRFIGNNTMTRYEMAQIVAKAMARSDAADAAMRSQIERLAAEFADELDSLGVRVARLEKNADNVRITGEARFSNYSYDKRLVANDVSKIRTRIWLTGQVNDNWQYAAMLENNGHDFKTNAREDTVTMRRAWVAGTMGDFRVMAGRFSYTPVFGTVLDNDADGILIGVNTGIFKLNAFAIRPTIQNGWFDTDRSHTWGQNVQVYGGEIAGEIADGLRLVGAYYRTDGSEYGGADGNIYEAGLDYQLNDDFGIWGQWVRGSRPEDGYMNTVDNSNISKNGWAAGLRLSKAVRNQPGTFEVRGSYYDVPALGSLDTKPELDITSLRDGYKGWNVGASIVAAKNIDINVDYYDFKTQGEIDGNKQKEKLIWSYVRFYF